MHRPRFGSHASAPASPGQMNTRLRAALRFILAMIFAAIVVADRRSPAYRIRSKTFSECRELVARRATSDHKKRRTRPVLFSVTISRRHWKGRLFLGGRTRARTWDPLIKSQLLYQLSYAPGTGPEGLRKRASFSKATPRCPANRGRFSQPLRRPWHGKSRQIPAAFSMIWRAESARSEPLAAAGAVPIGAAIVAVHAALEPAVPPAFCAKLAAVMGQERKPTLLAIVEGLVERVSRIRDLL
jgi:hypothetical protein